MTNEICPHCHLPRQGAHSCMHSMRAEIELLRDQRDSNMAREVEIVQQLHAAVKTAQELAARRLMEINRLQTYNVAQGTLLLTVQQENERLRGEAEVADEQLAQLRGFAEAHKTCRGSDEPLPCGINESLDRAAEAIRQGRMKIDAALSQGASQSSPFDSAAILAAPRERRISMSFQTQEQYEAALVFLDMADEGASRDASSEKSL